MVVLDAVLEDLLVGGWVHHVDGVGNDGVSEPVIEGEASRKVGCCNGKCASGGLRRAFCCITACKPEGRGGEGVGDRRVDPGQVERPPVHPQPVLRVVYGGLTDHQGQPLGVDNVLPFRYDNSVVKKSQRSTLLAGKVFTFPASKYSSDYYV